MVPKKKKKKKDEEEDVLHIFLYEHGLKKNEQLKLLERRKTQGFII